VRLVRSGLERRDRPVETAQLNRQHVSDRRDPERVPTCAVEPICASSGPSNPLEIFNGFNSAYELPYERRETLSEVTNPAFAGYSVAELEAGWSGGAAS
jgi:hypothetical protein